MHANLLKVGFGRHEEPSGLLRADSLLPDDADASRAWDRMPRRALTGGGHPPNYIKGSDMNERELRDAFNANYEAVALSALSGIRSLYDPTPQQSVMRHPLRFLRSVLGVFPRRARMAGWRNE